MEQYFESYEELDVHYLMLSDKPRTEAYKNAILNSKDVFKDKVVLDVGAGTGILSVFCAQAGARKIYAVEASELATLTEKVIKENGLIDRITVIHCKIEDVALESIEKIDIIVSEWMGFHLVHEGMLDSVLYARDNFLKEGGILYPSIAKLYVVPCELPTMYQFWEDVYGVNMKCIAEEYRKRKAIKPEVLVVSEESLLADPILLAWLDLNEISPQELSSLGGINYVCPAKRDGKCQGICLWFSVEFPDGSELSTAPNKPTTHWKQIAVVLPKDREVEKDEPIAFKMELKRDTMKPRQYNIELDLIDAFEIKHPIPCSCYATQCIVTRKQKVTRRVTLAKAVETVPPAPGRDLMTARYGDFWLPGISLLAQLRLSSSQQGQSGLLRCAHIGSELNADVQ